jgi:hypothetical protein
LFDQSVRIQVGGGHNTLLTDYHHFHSLYSMLTESSTTSWGVVEDQRKKGPPDQGVDQTELGEGRRRSVKDITVNLAAGLQKKSVISDMPVKLVEMEGMRRQTATQRSIRAITQGMAPKYLHYNIWDPDSKFTPNTSDWIETAEPLSSFPDDESVTKIK